MYILIKNCIFDFKLKSSMRILGYSLIIVVLFAFMVSSCSEKKTKVMNTTEIKDVDPLSQLADSVIVSRTDVSAATINELSSTIPKPIEILYVLEQSGGLYSPGLMNKTVNMKSYKSVLKFALNMGVYKADFSYMNINNDKASVNNFLNNISQLARQMGMTQFFDDKVMNRFKTNIENKDSLQFITEQTFERINKYLTEKGYTGVSVLINYGAWLESLYLSTATTKIENKEYIYKRVGEQQVALDNMLFLLSVFSNNSDYKNLLAGLSGLSTEYSKVAISYSYGKPTIKEVDGRLEISDNSTSTVNVKDEVFANIGIKVKEIRDKIVE